MGWKVSEDSFGTGLADSPMIIPHTSNQIIIQWPLEVFKSFLISGLWDYGELRCRMNREAATGLRISVDAKEKRPSCGVAKRSLGGSGMLVPFSWE